MGSEFHSPSGIPSLLSPSLFTTRLLKDKEGLINSPSNYLLYVLIQADKEVIRMDKRGLQEVNMFHCQDNATFPSPPSLTND